MRCVGFFDGVGCVIMVVPFSGDEITGNGDLVDAETSQRARRGHTEKLRRGPEFWRLRPLGRVPQARALRGSGQVQNYGRSRHFYVEAEAALRVCVQLQRPHGRAVCEMRSGNMTGSLCPD